MLRFNKKAQSMLEYAILFSVIIAALLIMQAFIKRGFQGGLKDSADKMGEQFSAGGTTIYQSRSIADSDQVVREAVGTSTTIDAFVTDGTPIHVADQDNVYSATTRTGGATVSETKSSTDSASLEKVRASEYQDDVADEFTPTNIDF